MKKKHNKLLLLFVCFCLLKAEAQNVIVTGAAYNGGGKLVELVGYADRISMLEQVLAKDTVNSENKRFTLKTSINYPTFVFLRIENYLQGFFIQPNQTYEVQIPTFDWNQDELKNAFMYPDPLAVDFLNLPENDLNFLIDTFDNAYVDLLQKYSRQLLIDKNIKCIDSIKTALNPYIEKGNTNEYFKLYTSFRIAEIELSCNPRSRKKMFEQYFNNKSILYQHIGYMDFFNLYFDHFYTNGTQKISYSNVENWVNENQLFRLLDSLGVEPMLKNEVLRELVMLKGLNEAFFMSGYNSAAVLSLIQTFANETRFPEHKKIAENIIAKMELKYKPFEAKEIVLPDVNKNPVSLEKFNNKWIYVSFVKIREPESLRELETMAFYKDTLYKNGNFEFLTIDCDREFLRMYHFLENTKNGSKYNWTWLHFDNNFALLERFQVGDYPSFALINPQGKVVMRNAPAPRDGFFVNPYFLHPKSGEQDLKNSRSPFHD